MNITLLHSCLDGMHIFRFQQPPLILHEKLLKYFKSYLFTGGMPSSILEYILYGDLNLVRTTQIAILDSYRLDFAKHSPRNIIMKINQVWDVIPSQLAKENKKFMYSAIRKSARAQEFEEALKWLEEAGLIHKTYNTKLPKLPLSAYISHDAFKIYLADVGLLGAMAGLSAKSIIYGDTIFQEFQGAFIENYVTQELVNKGFGLFYWTSNSQAELDFLIQLEDKIYPAEVKLGISNKKKSLISYIGKYKPDLAIRISPMNLKLDGNILNCPLYLLDNLSNIIKLSRPTD